MNLGFRWHGALGAVLCLAVITSDISPARGDEVARLVIEITGVESGDGAIIASVFNSEAGWMKTPVYSETLPIADGGASLILESVPYGAYAVSVIHDENGNGELDTGLMRIPTESYGFSNDAKASFGPASWEDSKFPVESAIVRISISMDD